MAGSVIISELRGSTDSCHFFSDKLICCLCAFSVTITGVNICQGFQILHIILIMLGNILFYGFSHFITPFVFGIIFIFIR